MPVTARAVSKPCPTLHETLNMSLATLWRRASFSSIPGRVVSDSKTFRLFVFEVLPVPPAAAFGSSFELELQVLEGKDSVPWGDNFFSSSLSTTVLPRGAPIWFRYRLPNCSRPLERILGNGNKILIAFSSVKCLLTCCQRTNP